MNLRVITTISFVGFVIGLFTYGWSADFQRVCWWAGLTMICLLILSFFVFFVDRIAENEKKKYGPP